MKKFVALLLALALVVTGIAAAMADYDMVASMKKWVDVDLAGYRVVQLFNYNESVAVNVGQFVRGNTGNAKIDAQGLPSVQGLVDSQGRPISHVIPTTPGGANTVAWDHKEGVHTSDDAGVPTVEDCVTIDGFVNDIHNENAGFNPAPGIKSQGVRLLPYLEYGNIDFGYDGIDVDPTGNANPFFSGTGFGVKAAPGTDLAEDYGFHWEYETPNYDQNLIPEYYAVGEATRWIDNSVAKEETNPHGTSKPKDAARDVRYVISGTFVAGFEVGREILDNGSTKNVVPVDLGVEENTVFVYPIATNSHVVIGLLFAKVNVEEGFVQIEVQYKDELYRDWGTTLEVFTTRAQLVDGGAEYELAEPISIEEELGGAQAILISITGKVTYPTLFGNLKSGKRLAYQDYYRYEKWVKSYRTNLTAALALVPEE